MPLWKATLCPMNRTTPTAAMCACLLVVVPAIALEPVVLYEQNFENPDGFVNDGGDINIFRTINQNYGNQPPGFEFAQAWTVETLLITGDQAFGTGYSDPSGTGGNHALGMLSSAYGQDDLLGLSFDVSGYDFLVLRMDISSIDLSVQGGPFVTAGAVPMFEYALYDNPSGEVGLGSGTLLASGRRAGKASPRDTFDWTAVEIPLDATAATNGKVTLRIDMLAGGYAAMDNFQIIAAKSGNVAVPPSTIKNIVKTPEAAIVTIAAVTGFSYTLERSATLTGVWERIISMTVQTDSDLEILDEEPPAGRAFYRIAIIPTP